MTDAAGRRPNPSLRAAGRGYRLERCSGCGLVPEHCACALLPRVETQTRVTLVAHFRELRKPSNTGRVAHRMLTNSRLLTRGAPSEVDARRTEQLLDDLDPANTLLLFPAESAEPLSLLAETWPRPLELVVPDGTWSQTRRVVRRHPGLQQLRSARLDEAPTRYLLRRGAIAGLSCTLEAIAAALLVLEGPQVADPLLRGFSAWQRAALAVRGRLCLLPSAEEADEAPAQSTVRGA